MTWMGCPIRAARPRPGTRLPHVLLAAVLAAVTGCGSGDQSSTAEDYDGGVIDVSGTKPLGEQTAGSVAQLVQCRDWNRGDEAQKVATIADVRGQVNSGGAGIDAPPLSDNEAMDVFDHACEPDHAQGFRLYILYARAAGVAPLTRDP